MQRPTGSARSEATRVRVGVLVHRPRDNSSCSAGLNPAVSSADRRSSQLVRARIGSRRSRSHWAGAQPRVAGSCWPGTRTYAGRRAACGHLASSDAEPLPAQLLHYTGVDWSASSLTSRGRREILSTAPTAGATLTRIWCTGAGWASSSVSAVLKLWRLCPLRSCSFVVQVRATAPEVAMQYALMIYAEPGYTRRCRMRTVRRRTPNTWRWPMTPGSSAVRSCSPPRRRPACAWSVAGR